MSVFDVFKQVITSWQVIVVTIVILLYIHIVSHFAKSYHRPRTKKLKINMFKKKPKQAVSKGIPEEVLSGSDSNEDLGIEEA